MVGKQGWLLSPFMRKACQRASLCRTVVSLAFETFFGDSPKACSQVEFDQPIPSKTAPDWFFSWISRLVIWANNLSCGLFSQSFIILLSDILALFSRHRAWSRISPENSILLLYRKVDKFDEIVDWTKTLLIDTRTHRAVSPHFSAQFFRRGWSQECSDCKCRTGEFVTDRL